MSSRQFVGYIRRFHVAGDEDPEIVISFAVPLKNVNDLSFLGGVKQRGHAVIEVQSAQPELPMEAPPQAIEGAEEPAGA